MIFDILVLISHVINRVTGGNMYEPLSSRCYREGLFLEKIIDKIFFWEKDHCKNAHLNTIRDIKEFLQKTLKNDR